MKNHENAEQLKELVKEKYGAIATEAAGASGCCGSSCGCGTIDNAVMADPYDSLQGHVAEADLGLGCGLPTEFAHISEGQTVIDLGSGAGNDAFVARNLVGPRGKVIGIDLTPAMVARAAKNASTLGYRNVEFRLGDIESIPLADNTGDVVVSNCVFNLVPDKALAFRETFRVLKSGGHFSISDIVLEGDLPDGLKMAAEMYAGCVSGAIAKEEYLSIVKAAGFKNVLIQKEKDIALPEEILNQYLSAEELAAAKEKGVRIASITLYAEKPVASSCCGPECCNS